MTLSDRGVSYFFLNSFAGRQAGSLSCLALSCLVVTVCVMNHHMGRGEGAKRSERFNVSFFSWGEGGRTDGAKFEQDWTGRRILPYVHIYTYIRLRAREE